MDESKTKKYRRRLAQLRDDQTSWREHWQEIADYTMPRKGRYLDSDSDDPESEKGSKLNQKIINGTAQDALEVLAAGMQGGLTSPSRPWFILSIPDKDLMNFAPVKQWLTDVRDILLQILSRTNFYGSAHHMYKELGAFGVNAQMIEEDFETYVGFRPYTIGEYLLSLDSMYRPAELYRMFTMSALQMQQKFGEENLSERVKSSLDKNPDNRFEVCHVINPNSEYREGVLGVDGLSYESVYFEKAGDHDTILKREGYDGKPFIAPRWDVTSIDTYGTSPGMKSLGDNKMLQKMEEKALRALDKIIDPPMNAHPSLKNKGASIVPGHVNYIASTQGQVGFSPAYQINPNIQTIEYKIQAVEQRIKRQYYNDLFLMIANNQEKATAYEVAKKHEEKLLLLSPVVGRIQSESHDPIIDRTFNIANRFGLLPPPPQELEGRDVNVEYVSILATAQKMVGVASVEQTTGFIGNLAGVIPEALDNLNVDETVKIYTDLTGAPPKMLRGDREVAQIRQQRMQQVQAQQNAERMQAMVEGGKTMSDTKLNEESALDSLLSNLAG